MSADPTVFDTLKTAAAAAVVWFGGESGRIIVAGGVGGLARWFQSEKRRIRDGMLAVCGGAMVASFLWPAPLHIIGTITGALEKSPENIAMSAFLAGTLGMSLVKVLMAMVEARSPKKGQDDG